MQDPESSPLAELRADDVAAAERHGQATRVGNSRAANRAYAQGRIAARALRAQGAEGEGAVLALLSDADPSVRVWAAFDALPFAPADAERTLRAVAGGPPSPERLSAEIVLGEWRAGRLSHAD